MRRWVASEIGRFPLRVCETVLLLTPAFAAISAIVARFAKERLLNGIINCMNELGKRWLETSLAFGVGSIVKPV